MAGKMRLLIAAALTIAIAAPASAKAQQIRTRADGVHWSEYYRKDGALISVDMGTQRTGSWKIQGNKLCKSDEKNNPLTCYEVWMSGDNISLRLNKDDKYFVGVVEKHGAN
jgi:hypothetical protein